MHTIATPYTIMQELCSLLMMVALLWLTVSAPFVYAQQTAVKQSVEKSVDGSGDADSSANTNPEESKESGAGALQEEYLHTAHSIEHHFITLIAYYKCHSSNLYFAYHPDTLSPPPDGSFA